MSGGLLTSSEPGTQYVSLYICSMLHGALASVLTVVRVRWDGHTRNCMHNGLGGVIALQITKIHKPVPNYVLTEVLVHLSPSVLAEPLQVCPCKPLELWVGWLNVPALQVQHKHESYVC